MSLSLTKNKKKELDKRNLKEKYDKILVEEEIRSSIEGNTIVVEEKLQKRTED